MAIYNPVVAAAAVVHVLFAVMWMGTYITIEFVILRDLRNAKRLQDLGSMKNHAPRLSKVALIMGILTLVTGLAYLFIKFGTDFGVLVSLPESRTILGAFWIVVFLLVFGIAVLKPRAAALGKAAATLDPTQPLPEDFLAAGRRLADLSRVQGVGLLLTLVLMVLAVQGGI